MAKANAQLAQFHNKNISLSSIDDTCEDEMVAPTIIQSKHDESDEEKGQRESVIAVQDKMRVQETSSSLRKSMLKHNRASLGFGSRVQSPRNESPIIVRQESVDQQVTVVATLVTRDRDGDDSAALRKKSICLQKMLIALCIVFCVIIAGVAFMLDNSRKETASMPSNAYTEDLTTENLSINPSTPPSNLDIFSPSPSAVSKPSSPNIIWPRKWKLGTHADIGVGAGSYYTWNSKITVRNEQITNEVEAFAYIESMNSKHPQNPIIMWMITPPTSGFVGLLAHRLLFLSQNLDASTGKGASGFVQDSADFLEITGREGGDVYYQEENSWRIMERCDIGIGSGSSFENDASITIHEKNIATEEEGYAFTELFNLKHVDNPIIMWEISWANVSYRAHRLKFFSNEAAGNEYANSEDFVNDAVDFLQQTHREASNSNNVFYSIA